MRTRRFVLAAALFIALDGSRAGGDPALGVRNAHTMAYDAERRRVVLFGGADEQGVRGELWEWDGSAWRLVCDGGPAPRTFPALAYDRERRRLVLFGGNRVLFGRGGEGDTFLDDTWEFDGAAWIRIDARPGPPARAEASMAFDAARRRVVLFGGYRRANGATQRLGDTWTWDGAAWRAWNVAEAPSARSGAAVAYDAGRQLVVLFGGNDANAETWEWDGAKWLAVDAPAPGRFNSMMGYDAGARAIVRFGGVKQGTRESDTWLFDHRRWERIAVPGPEPRNHAAMAYDEGRGVLVLHGGHDGERVFGDTWEWCHERWRLVARVPPRPRVDNGH
jgi:hypothetical protein